MDIQSPENRKKNILILGAGYGGLACAKTLDKLQRRFPEHFKDFKVILIDRHDYQLYTPTLYEIATTPEAVANAIELKTIVTFPLNYALWGRKTIFVQGEVKTIDFKEKFVALADGQKIDFEYLVIALGSETNYAGIPGMKEYSYPIKNLYDALRIRDAVLTLFQSAKPQLNFLIIGAGASGVEVSGELTRWIRHLERTAKQKCAGNVTLLEAAADILPGFESAIIKKARKRLAKLGVKIMTNSPIKEVTKDKALLANGQSLPFDLLVWTGGTKAPAILSQLPHKTEKKGRAEVTPEMLCLSVDPHLDLGGKFFAIGDAACFYHPKTGQPIPGVARAAIEQGKVVAKNILADLMKIPLKAFRPANYPYVIPVGGKWAIARFGPLTISGFFGWILKGLVELYYITSVLPLGMALAIWLKGLKIFIQND